MTDSFKEEIRDRMSAADLILPAEDYDLNREGAALTVEHLRPVLYEIIGRTARTNREQSVAAWHRINPESPSVDTLSVSDIVMGQQKSVMGVSPPADAMVAFDLHTHTVPGSLRPSVADIQSITGTLLQYPADVSGPATSRHFGIVTQRLGEPEAQVASIRAVTADPSVTRLSIEEQKEITQDAIEASKGSDLRLLNERLGKASEYLESTTAQFDLPVPAERLHFRSAIPDTVSDRRFGNAFADGDLTEVLRGVEYV